MFPGTLNWPSITMRFVAISYGSTRRHVARDIVFGVSPRMTKHASAKYATCRPSRGDKKCFCCLPETFACLSLRILSRVTKFPRWINWETSRGHVCDNVARDMSPSLARPSVHLESTFGEIRANMFTSSKQGQRRVGSWLCFWYPDPELALDLLTKARIIWTQEISCVIERHIRAKTGSGSNQNRSSFFRANVFSVRPN